MNENLEEQRRRSGQGEEGPRILSIQESEPENRAPPDPTARGYISEWTRRSETPPRIVERPKTRTSVKILVLILICSNIAFFWLYQQQAKEVEEIVGSILEQSLKEIGVHLSGEEPKVEEPFDISVEGLTKNLFSKFGLNFEEVKVELVISRGETELVTNQLTLDTSQTRVLPGRRLAAGSYDVILRITYKEITRERNCGSITIKEA